MNEKKNYSPKILLIGFGNAGKKFIEILSVEKDKFCNLSNFKPKVTGIFTKNHGSIKNNNGIDIHSAWKYFKKMNCFDKNFSDYTTMPVIEAVKELDYDILVELSTLSIKEKGEPAVSFVKAALNRSKSVVTANKGPAAFAYNELELLAGKNKCNFLNESSVMDGAPVFNLFKHALIGCRVKEIAGILNSTTNFILSQMEEGTDLNNAIKEAKKLGFVEAEPSHDIDGWDAAVKITVLANSLMNAYITPLDVEREGIRNITFTQLQNAIERGYHLKLVCRAWYEDNKIRTRVSVEEIPDNHIFASVNGTGSVLRVETDIMHPLTIIQEQPDLYDTAYGIINDLLSLKDG